MRTHRHTALAMLLLLAAAASSLAADTFTVDPVHSNVGFTIRHLVSKVRGRFNAFEGTITIDLQDLDASSVNLSIDAASIDTDNERRDADLRSANFFDVERCPRITFASDKITRADDTTFAVTGTLTMHGVSRVVTLPVTYLGQATDPWGRRRAGFEVGTTVDRKDYGITWNRTLEGGGLLLGDEVEVTVAIEAVLQEQEFPPPPAR